MKKILVLLGPNLNMVGVREKGIYGTESSDSIEVQIKEYAEKNGFTADVFQSNHEGDLIDKIHAARECYNGVVINAGALTMLFDKETYGGYIFPKDCEIAYAEKVPVIWEFRFNDPGSVMGSGHVMRDEKGLICEAELTRTDTIVDILREFDGELPIGGYYYGVKSHQGNHLRVFDNGSLTCIGVTLSPVDEEYRMRVVEKGEK